MRVKWFLILFGIVAAAAPAAAQPSAKAWAVWKLGNATADIVVRFESGPAAVAEREKRNAENPQPERCSYLVRMEKAGKAPSLKARHGQGTLGDAAVKIEFRGRAFVISGDLEGQGTWSQHGAGAVTMETALAVFRGLIDGDRVYGVRWFKDGSQPLTSWAFDLEPAKEVANAEPDDAVQQIGSGDLKAFSGEKGKAVIGILPGKDKGDGSVVTAVPGTDNRVWDGSTLAGFKELAAGKKVADDGAIDRMGQFLREQDPKKNGEIKKKADDLRAELLDLGEEPMVVENKVADTVRDEVKQILDSATPEEKQALLDTYVERGAPITHVWRPADLARIQWYQVPANEDVRDTVRNYQPPPLPPSPPAAPPVGTPPPVAKTPAGPTSDDAAPVLRKPLLDADLVGKIVPPKHLAYDESMPKTTQVDPVPKGPLGANPLPKNPAGSTAPGAPPVFTLKAPPLPIRVNNIASSLQKQAVQTQKTQTPAVVRPPEPVRAPVFQPTPRERKVETKPGGVIITACADIDGLKPADVASANFNPRTGKLSFILKAGGAVSCKLDSDDFTVAVRCIFDRQVDPSLSMSYGEKKGYKSVNYCGPLFKTRFGLVLYRTDELLGSLIFNREGPHRAVAAGIIPGYEDMTCEAHRTMTSGSRVFLRASVARFTAREGRLVCRAIKTRVDVEGMRYSADYFQESLHRLARAMDEHFGELADSFDDFQDFRRLVHCVALAKWIKRHAVPFEWEQLKERAVAETEVPALVPAAEWSRLFNGRNLDGWQMNLASGEADWSVKDGALRIEPAGGKALELLAVNYWKDYDLRCTVVTEGPVEFILRNGVGAKGAAVTIDTHGRPQRVELFLADGAWTAVAPGFGRQGRVTIPEPAKGQPLPPNEVGFRVPSGSRLTLYTASLRGR